MGLQLGVTTVTERMVIIKIIPFIMIIMNVHMIKIRRYITQSIINIESRAIITASNTEINAAASRKIKVEKHYFVIV